MVFVLYLIGTAELIGAAYFGVQALNAPRSPAAYVEVAMYLYAVAGLVVSGVLMLAAGRALALLADIAAKSRHLYHLRRLDPKLAAQMDSDEGPVGFLKRLFWRRAAAD